MSKINPKIPTDIPHWKRRHLVRDQRYRVSKPFEDADGLAHPIGEEWRFLGSSFSRFDNIYFLFIEFPSNGVRMMPLRSSADKQQSEVASHFDEYVIQI